MPNIGDSGLESLVANICAEASLTGLVFQYPIRLNGRDRRIDFAVPDLKLAIESDGYEFHRGRQAFEDDRRRGQVLTAAGYTVIRVTWRQLVQEPLAVVARLASALSLGGREK